MDRFSEGRKVIVRDSLVEKRRTRKQSHHDETEDIRRLKLGDPRIFQKYGIKMNKRATKPGLDEKTQRRYLHKNIKEIKEQTLKQERAAVRSIEKGSTRQVKEMRDDLRSELYSTAA